MKKYRTMIVLKLARAFLNVYTSSIPTQDLPPEAVLPDGKTFGQLTKTSKQVLAEFQFCLLSKNLKF